MGLSTRGIETVRNDYPQLYDALVSIVGQVDKLGATVGASAQNVAQAPMNAVQLNVSAANGIFDVQIVDVNAQRGELYFLEWDTDASFKNAKTIFLGPARAWRGYLGSLTLFWRVYKQLIGSNVSGYVSLTAGVVGGGNAGPTPQATTGSGSSQASGQGFGQIGATAAQVSQLQP
jgi:hypothetical protein